MTSRLRKLIGAAAIVVAGMTSFAVLNGDARADGMRERIEKEGYIRIGFANEPPFGFATSAGTISGEAPEIARVVLDRMGLQKVKVEGVVTEFGSLIPGLVANRFDMIAAGMFVRPARCEQIAFSEPTVGVGIAIMVKAGNPKNLHSFEDIAKSSDAKLAVVSGGAELEYARATKIPDDRLHVLLDNPSGMAAVVTGQADAFALSSIVIQNMIDTAKNPAIERATPFTDPIINGASVRGYGAFGFRKDDADFVKAFNAELVKFIGSKEHRAIVTPYGFTEAELPGDMTTAKLCAPAGQ
ncbi:MAG: ectoine/hydroxyectoine ABC transporter substrate-binding protein EhuB [Parvibaculaceae bacterium]